MKGSVLLLLFLPWHEAVEPINMSASRWYIDSYQPSFLEELWTTHGTSWQSDDQLCERMHNQRAFVHTWLKAVNSSIGKYPTTILPESKALSKITYKSEGGTQHKSVWIEPLAGLLRHPHAFCSPHGGTFCYSARKPRCREFRESQLPSTCTDRDGWLLLSMPPGPHRRSILFDVGCSMFMAGLGGASTGWFVNSYLRQLGVAFDDIFAWESKFIDPVKYWRDVPLAAQKALRFFNRPASAMPGAKDNPLELVRVACTVIDFCVIKIDVDVSELEEAWLEQIQRDRDLSSRIDVLFYEHHVGSPHAMAERWWGPDRYPGNISDSYRLFTRLRKLGIQAHSWP